MDKRGVYIVGEDPVTRAVIYRILNDYAPSLYVISEQPARGSEIKAKIKDFNKLAQIKPVILLADMDAEPCAPQAKTNLLKGVGVQSSELLVNIAVDEAEAWLYADREGLAKFLKVNVADVPQEKAQKFGGPRLNTEIDVPVKTSYHLTHSLIAGSSDATLKKQISSDSSCKGKEYNSAMLPFIERYWNIERARTRSYSLDGMIRRVQKL